MEVEIRNNDIDQALRELKKQIERCGLVRELKLKGIAKISERRREKGRLSERRRKNREGRNQRAYEKARGRC